MADPACGRHWPAAAGPAWPPRPRSAL